MNGLLLLRCTLWCTLMTVLGARGAEIFCRCNTWDCEQQSLNVCTTDFQCYVQVTRSEDPNEPPDILYGCLAQTSILCQNPRPQHFQGSWPIVQCCSTPLCNRDIMPTEPPVWHRGRHHSTAAPLNKVSSSPTLQPRNITVHPNRHTAPSSPSSSSSHFPAINPLYIAVPVAGAVILVVLIVFAVYLLRRQPQSPSAYKYHSAPQLSINNKPQPDAKKKQQHANGSSNSNIKPKHHNVLLMPPRNHNGLLVTSSNEKAGVLPVLAVEPFNSKSNSCNTQCGVTGTQGQQQQQQQGFPPPGQRYFHTGAGNGERPYPDGERSSSGSESKLLLPV